MIVIEINGIFGLATGYYKLSNWFEPIISRLLQFGNLLVKINPTIHQFTFLSFVIIQRQAAVQLQIKQAIQLCIGFFLFAFQLCEFRRYGGLFAGFFVVEFSKHVISPVLGQGDSPHHVLQLFGKKLFTQIFFSTDATLFRTVSTTNK